MLCTRFSLSLVTHSLALRHLGTIETLKHHKQDVMEMRKGTECGLTLADFGTLKPGDIIQIFETIEIPGVL